MGDETTPLPPDQVPAFQAWIKNNGITDLDNPDSHYDYRGAFLAGVNRDGASGHFPDTFKQHGHPTFSVESQYSTGPNDGGTWNGDKFIPAAPATTPPSDPTKPKPGQPGWTPSGYQGAPAQVWMPSSLRAASDATNMPGNYYDPYAKYDTHTGAPVKTRMAIAAAAPKDQVAVAQSMGLKGAHMTPSGVAYYKDDGTPAYADPTLWGNANPRDYLGTLATLPAKAGSMIGAAVGGLSAAEAPPMIPVAGAAGGAAGGAVGRSMQANLNAALGIPAAPSGNDAGSQAISDAQGGAYQEAGGLLLGRLTGRVAKSATDMVQRVKTMKDFGFDPTLGQATGSRTLQGGDAFLSQLPGSAGAMQRNAEGNVANMGRQQALIAGGIGGAQAPSREAAGEMAQDMSVQAGKDFATKENALRQQAQSLLPSRFPLTNVQAFLKNSVAQLQRAPNSLRDQLTPAIKQAAGMVKDAQRTGNAYDVPTLLSKRTEIGQAANFSSPLVQPGAGKPALGDLYDALNKDIDAAAQSSDKQRGIALPAGATDWLDESVPQSLRDQSAMGMQMQHDAHVSQFRSDDNPAGAAFFNKAANADQPESALKMFTGGGKEYTKRVMAIKAQVGPDNYAPIAAAHYMNLGTGTNGDFDAGTFLRNYGRLSDGEKQALYGDAIEPGMLDKMDKFAGVIKAMKGSQQIASASPYLRGQGVRNAAEVFGAGAAGTTGLAMTGHSTAAPILGALTLVGPKVASTAMTSQPLVSMLTGVAKVASKAPQSLGSVLGRLATLPLQDRDEQQARDSLVRALQQQYGGPQ